MNRTTFYAHFDSVEALAAEAFTELSESILRGQMRHREDSGRSEPSLKSLLEAIHYVSDRHELYLELLGNGTSPFFHTIEDALATRTAQLLDSIGALSDERDVSVAARFIAAGIVGVIAEWLRGGRDEDPDRLARRLLNLLPAYLSRDADTAGPIAGPRSTRAAPGRTSSP